MGLASALSTALTGLSASETTIDVVGNNLANANTVGFKASQANFANQFLQTLSLGSGPTSTSGGANPRQLGLGTMVADVTPNFTQGTIEISSNPTDMAIQGDGFFIVEGRNTAEAYTRNGIFKMNAGSELTTITGNRLLGYGVNNDFEIQTTSLVPVSIPIGSLTVANATTEAEFSGTLAAQGTVADAAKIIQTGILGDAGYTYPSAVPPATVEVSGKPNIGAPIGFTPTTGGTLASGNYYYKLVFSDGAPTVGSNLEGTPSDASILASVTNPATNAVDLTNLNSLTASAGHYTNINIYRYEGVAPLTGTFNFISSVAVGTTHYLDDGSATPGAALNTTLLNNNEYSYYVAFGKSGSDPSRPSAKIGPLLTTDGRIHLTNLPSAGANPNGWDSWIIYRNAPSIPAAANRYFEVTQVPFTSTTDSYTDTTADSNLYTSETVHSNEIDLDGPKIQESTLLTNVRQRDGETYNQVFSSTGTISFRGMKGGHDTATRTFTLTPTSSVADFSTFLEQTLGIQESTTSNGIPSSIDVAHPTAAPIPPGHDVIDGRIRLTGNNGTANAIDIGALSGTLNNLSFTTYQDAEGESLATNFNTYDSLGISCNVELTAVLESRVPGTATIYRWFADSKDNQPSSGTPNIAVGTGLISFDSDGAFISATQTKVSIDRSSYPSTSPLQFDVDFSKVSCLGTTSSMQMSQQNGFAPGVLSSFIVGEDGLITGVFSNSATRTLAQIRLARFGNPAGLQQLGENMYAAGVNSGMPIEGNPGEQGIGTMVAGATELSNADVGTNLINLILASTMYRSNTRTISTVQQMLDTLLQLQR